jgi:hypothetical protein
MGRRSIGLKRLLSSLIVVTVREVTSVKEMAILAQDGYTRGGLARADKKTSQGVCTTLIL